MAAADIQPPAGVDGPTVVLIVVAVVVTVTVVLAVLAAATGRTWRISIRAVVDYLRPSADASWAPTATARAARRPGAHRAANKPKVTA